MDVIFQDSSDQRGVTDTFVWHRAPCGLRVPKPELQQMEDVAYMFNYLWGSARCVAASSRGDDAGDHPVNQEGDKRLYKYACNVDFTLLPPLC